MMNIIWNGLINGWVFGGIVILLIVIVVVSRVAVVLCGGGDVMIKNLHFLSSNEELVNVKNKNMNDLLVANQTLIP